MIVYFNFHHYEKGPTLFMESALFVFSFRKLESVKIHHFVPRFNEIVNEFFL